jgi:hypothetical protein
VDLMKVVFVGILVLVTLSYPRQGRLLYQSLLVVGVPGGPVLARLPGRLLNRLALLQTLTEVACSTFSATVFSVLAGNNRLNPV